MAQLLLIHHTLGLTPALRRLADAWRDAGHEVFAPDLFDGRVLETLPEGIEYAESVGFETLAARGEDAAGDLLPGFVACGVSLGALPAMRLAVSDDALTAVVAAGACVPAAFLGGPWPRAVSLRVIASEHDALFREEGDLEAARELTRTAADAKLKLMPGAEHLFMEAGDPDSRAATERLFEVVLRFLERADEALPGPEAGSGDESGDEDLSWDLP